MTTHGFDVFRLGALAALGISIASSAACSNGAAPPENTGGGPSSTSSSTSSSTTGSSSSGAGGEGGGPDACPRAWGGDLQMGTALDDEIMDLAHDAQGNLYVTGYEAGRFGISNTPPDGDARAFVAKHDPTGKVLWKRVLDTAAADVGEGLAIDPVRGDVYVVGRTKGAFPGFQNQGQSDLFLAILDAQGEVKKIHQTGSEKPEHPLRIALGGEGRVVVAGYDDVFVQGSAVMAWEEGFVLSMKVDPDAGYAISEAWWKRSGTKDTDMLFGLAVEPGEGRGIYVSGFSLTEGAFVSKLDADGKRLWRHVYSPHGIDAMTALSLSPSGRLFVTGASSIPMGEVSYGGQDVVVIELDPATGDKRWVSQYGSSAPDWPTAIALDAAGNIHVTGTTLGSMKKGVENQGEGDLFALTIDPSGAVVSVWQRGTPADDVASSISIDACGSVFVAGHTWGAMIPEHENNDRLDMVLMRP